MAAAQQPRGAFTLPFESLHSDLVHVVGGKNASLGEMVRELSSKGVRVPDGFATTADAFRLFVTANHLGSKIQSTLEPLDVHDTAALRRAGLLVRGWFAEGVMPEAVAADIRDSYRQLSARVGGDAHLSVAVRSSATAEDLPNASFAGQQETYLNVEGEEALVRACKRCFASLYTDRAISYRRAMGFPEAAVALSVGVQRMVRSDIGASGVIFTIDTESGFPDVCMVTAAWGLGETVVSGAVNPDEFVVFKPLLERPGAAPIVRASLGSKAVQRVYRTRDQASVASDAIVEVPTQPAARERFCLSDADVLQLARYATAIEAHYSAKAGHPVPQDIEFAKDGLTGELFVVQARPETVESRKSATLVQFTLDPTATKPRVLCRGRAVGARIAAGRVRIILDCTAMGDLQPGEVLVTHKTDPDWGPILHRAAAIVTSAGGRTSHAAIVARELGIPAVCGVGDVSGLRDGQEVTVDCSAGEEGRVLAGRLPFQRTEQDTGALRLPRHTKLCLIMGNPDNAFHLARLPVHGVGLVRLEFIVSRVGLHPKLCLEHAALPSDDPLLPRLFAACKGAASPAEFYVSKLAEGVATIAASFYPHPVIVRLSDFKSNEYKKLLGGERYEPTEENPMLGWRGASRYHDAGFSDAFGLECAAMTRARDVFGLTNVQLMVPFVRTVPELKLVLGEMARHGLRRGQLHGPRDEAVEKEAAAIGGPGLGGGLRVLIMCEVPSNVLLAPSFLEHCDGFSIGSNDLTQLTLGVDRDSGLLTAYDTRDDAVKLLIGQAIDACAAANKYCGLCGQGPSDYPDFAAWLVARGLRCMSLNADVVLSVGASLAFAEQAI